METVAEALALLERERVLTLVPVAGFRSLVAEIAGGPVRGSWWGHPRGKVIFNVATALEESGAALVGKLVQGKVAFVHRALWPALVRVVTDRAWRKRQLEEVPAPARELLAAVDKAGSLRLDQLPPVDKKAREPLEHRLLVHSASEHTASGKHATRLTKWSAWASKDVLAGAKALSLDAARAELERAGITLAR